MPTPTYDLIQEQVLSSAAASVTFSSIPSTYKDLIIECVARSSAALTNDVVSGRFNGDSGSNYSTTYLFGNGTSAASGRETSLTRTSWGDIPAANAGSNNFSANAIHVFSYGNSNVNKTAIYRGNNAEVVTATGVTLWRSTVAVTSIVLATVNSANFVSGSTFRLWGVSG